jgi:RNA polymerase sigma factor (TIGR02999 family)
VTAGRPTSCSRCSTASSIHWRSDLSHQARASPWATTLLHEAYLSIANRGELQFPDRARFLGYASRAMRGLIVDYARRRQAKKRGGEFHITRTNGLEAADPRTMLTDLDELSEALDQLGKLEPGLAQLVDLHFFCGLTFGEIAALRSVSSAVQRDGARPDAAPPDAGRNRPVPEPGAWFRSPILRF